LRFALLRGEDLLGLPAHEFVGGIALHWRTEHFQRATAGVDLVVMGEIGEALEDAEQLLIPGPSADFDWLSQEA